MTRVEYGEAFFADMRTQIDHLMREDELSRVDRLADDVTVLAERLSQFTRLGRQLTEARGRTLRRIAVGRLPYLVWYRHDPRGDGVVRMSRLFHMRQRTPKPRLL